MFLTYFFFFFHIIMCSFLSRGLSYLFVFPPLSLSLFSQLLFICLFYKHCIFLVFPNDLSCLQFLFCIFLYAVLCIVFSSHTGLSQFQQIHFLFLFLIWITLRLSSLHFIIYGFFTFLFLRFPLHIFRAISIQCFIPHMHSFLLISLSEIKVQKLSLGRYLFKRYMFVPQNSILVP